MEVHKMKPEMKIVLVAEDIYSAGRIMAVGGIVLILITFFVFNLPDILIGDVAEDWNTNGGLYIFGYTLSIILIILGLVAHHVAKWPEFVTEVFADGWMREFLRSPDGRPTRINSDIPPDLIVKVSKYRKKYSKRRKNWYVWLTYSLYYDGKIYDIIHYGWLNEPKKIEKLEEFVHQLEKLAEKNSGGKEIKVSFFDVTDILEWNTLEYSKELKEQRDKLIESGGEE